ncbi:hypothetical protein L210DRAFT_3511361 [Boletus edulis BED1]|uniref:Uncharacterized protein n=1 Tax=Boletus edulis BED1 TaxID=1328754 RepID=A0AAD4G6B9_BOLED|nr:hypothetical protein L210DRAFT_3511361 [Boletus edulis BED1]
MSRFFWSTSDGTDGYLRDHLFVKNLMQCGKFILTYKGDGLRMPDLGRWMSQWLVWFVKNLTHKESGLRIPNIRRRVSTEKVIGCFNWDGFAFSSPSSVGSANICVTKNYAAQATHRYIRIRDVPGPLTSQARALDNSPGPRLEAHKTQSLGHKPYQALPPAWAGLGLSGARPEHAAVGECKKPRDIINTECPPFDGIGWVAKSETGMDKAN